MKKIVLFVLSAILFNSCSPLYYQLCKVSSELETSESGAYFHSTNSCTAEYNFWNEGGYINFTISNKSDSIIYIDLSKSFLIKNDIVFDYFLNRIIRSSDIVSQIEKPIIAIPPHYSKVFSEYPIMNVSYKDCDLTKYPHKDSIAKMTFSISTTPVKFKNIICYRVGEYGKDNFIENSFYVNEIVNQHESITTQRVHIVLDECESEIDTSTKYYPYGYYTYEFIHTSPKEFYIKY